MPRLFGLLIMLMWLTTTTAATQVSGLYEATIKVVDESGQSRDLAIQQGLKEVITRVTGVSALEAHAKISVALKESAKYVNRYLYKRNTGTTLLWINFNSSAINTLIRQAGLPLWNQSRPVTLVWLAIEDGGKRVIVSSAAQSKAKTILQQISRRRGAPLRFPQMDLQDQRKVRFTDIRVGFIDSVKEASDRYRPDAILIGYMVWRGAKGWTVKWTFARNDLKSSWQAANKDRAQVLGAGINGLADKLSKSATKSSTNTSAQVKGRSQFYISVSNINSLEDYAVVNKYLLALSVVSSANVVKLVGDKALFAISTNAQSEMVQQVIGSAGTLVKKSANQSDEDPNFDRTNNRNSQNNFNGMANRQNTVFYRYKKQ